MVATIGQAGPIQARQGSVPSIAGLLVFARQEIIVFDIDYCVSLATVFCIPVSDDCADDYKTLQCLDWRPKSSSNFRRQSHHSGLRFFAELAGVSCPNVACYRVSGELPYI